MFDLRRHINRFKHFLMFISIMKLLPRPEPHTAIIFITTSSYLKLLTDKVVCQQNRAQFLLALCVINALHDVLVVSTSASCEIISIWLLLSGAENIKGCRQDRFHQHQS